jgi:putative ABC transport system permease protein
MAANAFTGIYLEFFNLPALEASYGPRHFIIGMLIALVSGGLGAFMGTRGVLGLNPGDAMRPAAPPVTKSDIFAKMPFIKAILASNGFMAVRNIARNPFRSFFILLGIAFSFAMIGFTSSFSFYIDRMLLLQFDKVELYDVKAGLREPVRAAEAAEAVYALKGVTLAEPLLELPCEIRLANLAESLLITGLEGAASLRRIYDSDTGLYHAPPKGGLIISGSLANQLNAARGDILTVKTPYTGDDELRVPVLGVVAESLGMNAYMELESLCGLLEAPLSANAVVMRAEDPAFVKDALRDADNIAAVTSTDEAKKVYEDLLQTYGSLFLMMQLAGVGVAFAIITNTASISLSERKREYATLRVLGMHPREIARIVGFEYWLLTAIGIWPGIQLLIGINAALLNLMDTTLFTLPTRPPANVYATAGLLCFATVWLCNMVCARRISKFDMVEVLKERE